MHLKRSRSEKGRKNRSVCECGQDIPDGASYACDRCRWLDGDRKPHGSIISALRSIGMATQEQIANEIGYNTRSAVVKPLGSLVRCGRVRKIVIGDCPRGTGRIPPLYELIDEPLPQPSA